MDGMDLLSAGQQRHVIEATDLKLQDMHRSHNI